jgi:DUF917 family protein
MKIDKEIVEFARLGGALLGGGGGGSMKEGKVLGEMAVEIGNPSLVEIADLPSEATLLTVSAVGAPAAREARTKPMDYVRAIEILEINGVQVDGIITCENGGLATLNGWFQSAVLNIPVVDAPANGRAHPMGVMGSMGLHALEGYLSKQAAVGGDPEKGRYFEIYASGPLDSVARLIRQTADLAGGLVGVARNPITVAYAKENAAVGAITQAIELGRSMSQAASGKNMVESILGYLGGHVIGEGLVDDVRLKTAEGFDVGSVTIKTEKEQCELTFWNEYMCAERGGRRLATFPDLIATVDLKAKLPVTTAEIKKGQHVAVLYVPKEALNLGAGMKDPNLLQEVERITGKDMIKDF